MTSHAYRLFMSGCMLFLGICFFVPAFAYEAAASPNSEKTTIVYSFPSNVGPLNPHLYSPSQMFAQEMVYEGLVTLGENGKIAPSLAENWEISPDGLEYRFMLRKGVTFSDGQPFTAEAVVKNFAAIMSNAKRHQWLPVVEKIASFTAAADDIFVLTLKEPYYPVLEDLALPRPFRMLSPAAFPADGKTQNGIVAPIGTGPWKLQEVALGRYDVFTRNDTYWGAKPKAERVMVKVIPDPLSRMVALETGEIDLVYGTGQISFDAFDALRRNPQYETAMSKPIGGMMLAVNSAVGPTKDLAVRQAFEHAFNRESIIQGVLLGGQHPAETYFASSVPYADVALKPYDYDPKQAEQLLEQAGWTLKPGAKFRTKDGEELRVKFCFVGNDPVQKSIGEILQSQLSKVGVRVELLGEEEDSYIWRQKNGDFNIIVSETWGPPFEPHSMLGSMRQPAHADYAAQSGLPMKASLDQKITDVLSTVDEAKRRALYAEILTTLHEQAVYIPVFYFSNIAAWKKDTLSDVQFAPGKTYVPFELFEKK